MTTNSQKDHKDIREFHAFHAQLTQAIEEDNVPLIGEMFHDPKFGPQFYEFYLMTAIDMDDVKHLELMLSFNCPMPSTRPLLGAIMADNTEHFKKLLPYAPKPLEDHNLISSAILQGNTEIVELLASRYETLVGSKALVWAVQANNQSAFDLVYPLSDVPQCVAYLKEQKYRGAGMRMLKTRIQQDQLHQKLLKATQNPKKQHSFKKI